MNDRRLQIYLDDHLALIVGEVALIGRCRSSNRDSPLGDFLKRLEDEVRQQQSVVEGVIQQTFGKGTIEGRMKQGAAWFAEKLGRLKLNGSLIAYSTLSRVLELEALTAAAQERIALWDNLDAVAGNDPRLHGIPFPTLREQSQRHLDELNSHRRDAAVTAFVGDQTAG